ncbi:MAG: M14 family metallopeptidase [Nitratireductor sp.]|nr:M14 family metallopeptidase [Nitratireductor sp.]
MWPFILWLEALMNTLDYTCVFGVDYQDARTKFLDSADRVAGRITTYRHPDETGPSGEELAIDVARLGSADAPRQLVIISGTHGLEGLSGSASQVAWLHTIAADALPPDTSVLLVHALNPWGFAHGSRTTENNVDLNRNFVDHSERYPENTGFSEFAPHMLPQDWTPQAFDQLNRAIADYCEAHGADAQFDALTRGQYDHPQAINFGGSKREWSNLTLEAIAREHLGAAQKIGFIDWHTGIGEWGESFFLCFNSDGSPEQDQAVKWWGEARILGQRPLGLQRPNYQGLVFSGLSAFLGERPMVGAVVEFGTRGREMRRALQLDIWLKFRARGDSPKIRMLREDMHDAFVPVSSSWRERTSAQAVTITDEALKGLSNW